MYPPSVRRLAFRLIWLVVAVEGVLLAAGLASYSPLSVEQASGLVLLAFIIGSLILREIRPTVFTEFYTTPVREQLQRS